MKLHVISEMPYHVPQEKYPYERTNAQKFEYGGFHGFEEEHREGDLSFSRNGNTYLLTKAGSPIGIAILSQAATQDSERLSPGEGRHVFVDINVADEHRNQGYGLMLYLYFLQHKDFILEASTAMTPSSRRVWNSLFRNPDVDVWGEMRSGERIPLEMGPEGLTAQGVDDSQVHFVAKARK